MSKSFPVNIFFNLTSHKSAYAVPSASELEIFSNCNLQFIAENWENAHSSRNCNAEVIKYK